ncbi:MAG: 50S ribosomal protein L18 [archaeon]
MSQGPTYKKKFKRRMEGKTNYVKRLSLLKSKLPRIIVRKSNKHFVVQAVKYEKTGDKVIAGVSSKALKKLGWEPKMNLPTAYLTGLYLGIKVKGKVDQAVLDLGIQTSFLGGRLFACLKGLLDSGIKLPFDEKALPSKDRIEGKHISEEKVKAFNDFKAKLLKGVKANE